MDTPNTKEIAKIPYEHLVVEKRDNYRLFARTASRIEATLSTKAKTNMAFLNSTATLHFQEIRNGETVFVVSSPQGEPDMALDHLSVLAAIDLFKETKDDGWLYYSASSDFKGQPCLLFLRCETKSDVELYVKNMTSGNVKWLQNNGFIQ